MPFPRDRWDQIHDLFHAAREHPADARAEFLLRACPHDPELRAEIESLLQQETGSFLETSPFTSAIGKGTKLASFELRERIGRGGMGEVWRAHDPRLQRDVAIKILPIASAAEPERVSRFQREARAASALNHPNIISVFDIGSGNGIYWIVSELVEGESLRDRMARGLLEQRFAVNVALQVAQGLAAAHAAGLVHRDVKPGNIMLGLDGRVRLVDFGLAKQTQRGVTKDTMTQPGLVVGTAGYMAPEQVRGENADCRADVFSFGVVLYELLSGKQAFAGASSVELMHAVLKEDPPALPPSVPPALNHIVRRCLEKEPERRFQNAAGLAFALEAAFRPPLPAQTGRRGWAALRARSRWAIVVGVTAALAVAAIVLYPRIRGGSPARPLTYSVEPLTAVGDVDEAIISPDGKLLAYTHGPADRLSLRIKTLATGEDHELTGARHGPMHGLAFSFDSKQIYVGFQGVTNAIPVTGGVPVEVLPKRNIGYAAPSPNGADMVFVPYDTIGHFGMYLARPDGGNERALIQYRFPQILYAPAWSPGGDALAFTGTPSGFFLWDIMTIAPHPGAVPRVISPRHFYRVSRMAWLHGGKAIAFGAVESPGHDPFYQIWEMSYPNGRLNRITNGLDSYPSVSASSDSSLLGAVREQNTSEILLLSQQGNMLRHLTTRGPAQEGRDGLEFLGDERLVFESKSSGTGDLWSIGLDGGNRRRLTDNGARNMWPSVSEPGHTILWLRTDRAPGLWAMDEDGSNVRRISPMGGNFWAETGSAPDSLNQGGLGTLPPDEKFITYMSTSSAGQRTLMRTGITDPSKPLVLSKLPAQPIQPAVSPDKRWIAFGVDTHGSSRTAVIPATGGDPVALLPINPWSIHWTGDGKSLIYIRNDGGVDNLWVIPVVKGQARQITQFSDASILRFASSVTGKYLAVVHGSSSQDAVLLRANREE